MNDEEFRRIRRLVVADPQLPALPPAVDPRQAERFHRALGAVRRAASSTDATAAPLPPPPSPSEAPAAPRQEVAHAPIAALSPSPGRERSERMERHERHERREGASSSSRRREPHRGEGASVDGQRPRAPVAAVQAPGARETQEAEADEAASLPDPASVTAPPMPIPNVAWTPLPEGWERDLTDTVSALCRSSEPHFHSWTIQVPVDAETLPHTELRLTFSPHHLLLRFSTQSTRSLALISAHQSQLRALLVRALPGDRHIEIDIT